MDTKRFRTIFTMLLIMLTATLFTIETVSAQGRNTKVRTRQQVYNVTDSTETVNGFIDYAKADTNAFTTTALLDTVVISGLRGIDKVLITPRSQASMADSSGIMGCLPKQDTLFVWRKSGSTSGGKYQYVIFK